ncbi:MAG TPA: hypothetical protein DDW30_03755 [Clostridiales bacterium]|nr:hypothetical protein [Clostridiales bacterium]
MSLLAPLGLLGLLGTGILIFIYLIKPNYQQKLVSSTYIWKLSLKYKKKRVPVSRLRNILIFLCQFLALAAFGLLLAQPVIQHMVTTPKNEKVVIIDASASMQVESDGKTRFERAVEQVKALAETTLSSDDGAMSVIVADSDAYLLVSRATAGNLSEVNAKLTALCSDGLACGYGSADMNGAAELAETILNRNSESEVLLYTATEYINQGGFHVVNVSSADDWNAAVLNCVPNLAEQTNSYSFMVDVGCYGRSKAVAVSCELFGVNKLTDSTGTVTRPAVNLSATKTEYFSDAEPTKTIEFTIEDFGYDSQIVTFEYMYVHIDEDDGFEKDNTFNVYGGEKPVLRVQYASTQTNNFFSGVLRSMRQALMGSYTLDVKTVAYKDAKTEGFDLYIFEHRMPEEMPTDGVVLLADPDSAPSGSGLEFGDSVSVDSSSTLASGVTHPLTDHVNPDRITVAKYRRVNASDGYDELLYYHGDPILLVKNEDRAKTVVLTLDLNNSSLGVVLDFPVLMYNLFTYFFPPTLTGNAFEVGESVTVNARGTDLTLDGPGYQKAGFDSLPATVILTQPGDYTVMQTNMKGTTELQQFFVHIPQSESNITEAVDELPLLRSETTMEETTTDLILWIAAAALFLLFAEWWLHSRESL